MWAGRRILQRDDIAVVLFCLFIYLFGCLLDLPDVCDITLLHVYIKRFFP